MIKYAKSVLTDFISIVYPENCVNCSDILVSNEQYLCTTCRLDLPYTDYHKTPSNPLFSKFSHIPQVSFASAFLYFYSGGIAQTLLHNLKYKNNPKLGEFLGSEYGSQLLDLGLDIDIILPVPIHIKKEKKRGYNQSNKIAKGLSVKLGIPFYDDYLAKVKHNATQTNKTKIDRWQNVDSVFNVTKPDLLANKKVLVIDDVITTGATVSELCDVLVKYQVADIKVCSIATGIK